MNVAEPQEHLLPSPLVPELGSEVVVIRPMKRKYSLQALLPSRAVIRRNISIGVGWFLGILSSLIILLLPLLIIAVGVRAMPLLTQPQMTLNNLLSQPWTSFYPELKAQYITLDNLFGQTWNPARNAFGLTPFIAGSLWVTITAMVIATPISLFSAIYLSEYTKPGHRNILRPLIELLAGIPSVVYGLWGVLVIVPFVKSVAVAIHARQTTGYSILSGALVLALMVTPFMIALMEEVMRMTPRGLCHASLAMGATRWEMVRHVLLRHSKAGLIAAVGLGFARALGETLAVMMVVGNGRTMPHSLLDPAQPLPAVIANNFGETMSIPRMDATLMMVALILLIMVLMFNIASRLVIRRMARNDS